MSLSDIEREKQRIRFSYEEELFLSEAQHKIALRLVQQKADDRDTLLDKKIGELRNEELAMLNILEDARDLEGKLQEQHDRLQLVINTMGEGLMLLEDGHLISLINTKAEDMLSLNRGEARGKCFHQIIMAWKGAVQITDKENFLKKEFESGSTASVSLMDNMYFQTASREKFPVAFVFTPFIEHAKKLAVIVFRDITEEKDLDKARTGFISFASHQLRTPLTAIRWYTELLMEKTTGTLNDMQAKFAQQIYEGTNRLTEMVNLLLSLARIEEGGLEINPSPIVVEDFMKALVDEFAPLAKKEGTSLTLSTAAHHYPVIMLDPAMLREVTVNLITNAIRYSSGGGAIIVSLTPGEKEITVGIKDSGIGIPLAQQNHIFEKFFRADNAIKKTAQGTGLGLNLAHSLVSIWYGRLWFTSKEGEGSTFFFTIPYEGIKEKRVGKPLA